MIGKDQRSNHTATTNRPHRWRVALLALVAGTGLTMGGCPPDGLSDPTVQTGLRAVFDGILDVVFAVYGDGTAD